MSSSFDSVIKWSTFSYAIKDIVDGHSHRLPLLCRITSGYCGFDEDLHEIAAGEFYWIYRIHLQKRLLVQPENGHGYMSIPTNYRRNIQVVSEDCRKVVATMPFHDLVKMMSSTPRHLRFIFENDSKVTVQIGSDLTNTASLGILRFLQIYDEKYLCVHAVFSEFLDFFKGSGKTQKYSISTKARGIPGYLPIKMAIAERFRDRDLNLLSTWMGKVNENVKAFNVTPTQICEEIILFNERPCGGEYEYIRLLKSAPINNQGPSIASTKSQSPHGPFPTRKPKIPGLDSSNRSGQASCLPLPHIPLGSRVIEKQVFSAYCSPVNKGTGPFDDGYEKLQSKTIQSLCDVPVDVSGLSLDQVADCLRLLKLDVHCQVFKARHIDGKMLMLLTEDILIQEFHFREFEAMQFIEFIQKGWRPK